MRTMSWHAAIRAIFVYGALQLCASSAVAIITESPHIGNDYLHAQHHHQQRHLLSGSSSLASTAVRTDVFPSIFPLNC